PGAHRCGLEAPMVVDVTPDNFEQEVVRRSAEVPVVVDFWAEWCGPCRMLGPVLERFAAEDEGKWVLAKVDTEAAPELAEFFQIQGIPAVKAFRNGEVVAEFVGAQPPPAVREWLDDLLPSAADLAAKEGLAALAAGDRDGAVAAFERAIGLERDHAEGLLSLAELTEEAEAARELVRRLHPRLSPEHAARRSRLLLRLDAGGVDEAKLAAALAERPEDLDTRWELAHALAAHERHEEALGHLLEIVRRDRKYRDDGARKAMLGIFDVVGARSELADAWRSRLAEELYK
ncbi:MAG: tetratricopeptide repeat protein, partial [Myxococcales bacterium]|nr:tetratricopeptide repeat protein [Myxococcales bacterium]